MITRIEALHYKCLKDIAQSLSGFQFLVGPNASGKTTFLDVISFLGTLVSEGIDAAIGERTNNFHDLLWFGTGSGFQLAINVRVPEPILKKLDTSLYKEVRYEISLNWDSTLNQAIIDHERVLLLKQDIIETPYQPDMFPSYRETRKTIFYPSIGKKFKTLVNKKYGGNDNFYPEVDKKKAGGWSPSFKLGPRKSALGNIPADETLLPVSIWLKEYLTEGIQKYVLNSLLIRKASAPGLGRKFRPDGSNLPWVIEDLKANHEVIFLDWIKHLRTALPDLESIRTVEQEDIRHRYLLVKYDYGLELPSWNISDGTLRLLALTLPAYLPEFRGVYLIEEPENGIHPKAIETVYKSLSSVYDAQVLAATHSPVILGMADPSEVLCFAKTPEGMTDIVRGSEHPKLREWHGEASLDILYAAGVLG